MSGDAGITLNWSGTLSSLLTALPVRTDEWLSEALSPESSELSLAEQTGLIVRIEQ